MNILHLIESSEGGGAETVVLSLAKALRNKGNNCVIGLLQTGWLNDQVKEAGFDTIIIEQKRSYDLGCLWRLATLVRKFKIDLIHAHEFMMNTYGTMTGFLKGIPVVTTIHGKNYYGEKTRRKIAYRFVSRLSRMVAVSDDLACFLAEEIGISKDRINTIYNGIDCERYNGNVSSGIALTVRESLSIPAQSPVVATVGMLFPVKDHLTLLRAAVKVTRRFPDVIFVICGDGELKDRLRKAANDLRIADNVRLAGFRDDIPGLLRITDVYVCSSLSEGLSLSILEAMAAGKPVVASNVGGNPEVVVHGKTGFLVPPQDPETLASKIILLLQNKLLSQQFGAEGQLRVHEKFSRERMVDTYQRLYQKALGTNN
jgi:glycosyltransferase involved in cell wall biosynthesis